MLDDNNTVQLQNQSHISALEKRNNLDEFINIPIMAEERSVIQISFGTQGPNIRQAQSGIHVKNYS